MREHAQDPVQKPSPPKERIVIAAVPKEPSELYEAKPPESIPAAQPGDFGAMPSPIRYFSYFFFTASFLLLILGILYQLFK